LELGAQVWVSSSGVELEPNFWCFRVGGLRGLQSMWSKRVLTASDFWALQFLAMMCGQWKRGCTIVEIRILLMAAK
jgi:hypothetical protein